MLGKVAVSNENYRGFRIMDGRAIFRMGMGFYRRLSYGSYCGPYLESMSSGPVTKILKVKVGRLTGLCRDIGAPETSFGSLWGRGSGGQGDRIVDRFKGR